jgi:hypothetical protein
MGFTGVIRFYNARDIHVSMEELGMLKQGKATMKLLVLTVLMLGAAVAAWAQSTGTLRGIITDTQGAVVPGVSVVVRNQATGAERTTVSDASGAYVAASLPPGPYRVEAQLQGFRRRTRTLTSTSLRRSSWT